MLDQIFAPIQYQIARFETRLEEIMTASDVGGIQKMAYHVVKNRGRRFRPALAFLTAQAVGECSDAVIDAAVGVEIIQTASLIHDDVIDNAETRRGADVLHFQWGNRAAILMGDFLFAKSMQVLVGLNSLPVMDATTHAIQRVVEGEILEGEISSSGEASLYFRMINKKRHHCSRWLANWVLFWAMDRPIRSLAWRLSAVKSASPSRLPTTSST